MARQKSLSKKRALYKNDFLDSNIQKTVLKICVEFKKIFKFNLKTT